jgi:hypothetical protein
VFFDDELTLLPIECDSVEHGVQILRVICLTTNAMLSLTHDVMSALMKNVAGHIQTLTEETVFETTLLPPAQMAKLLKTDYPRGNK